MPSRPNTRVRESDGSARGSNWRSFAGSAVVTCHPVRIRPDHADSAAGATPRRDPAQHRPPMAQHINIGDRLTTRASMVAGIDQYPAAVVPGESERRTSACESSAVSPTGRPAAGPPPIRPGPQRPARQRRRYFEYGHRA